MDFLLLGAQLLGYIAAARLVMRWLDGQWRHAAFTLLNLGALYWFFFHVEMRRYQVMFAAYVALAVFQYVLLRLFSRKRGWLPWLAFYTPIAALIAIRYIPTSLYAHGIPSVNAELRRNPNLALGAYFIGISYFAFRTSHLVLEVRNGAEQPGFFEYLGFCFFLPTMPVGPINPYVNHHRAFTLPRPEVPIGRSALRVLVGLVKFKFLGTLCNQLTYSGLLRDEHYHHWIDLAVAVIFYYLYLYCNFSGFCDAAIGAAGLIGIPVAENFQNPFAARNMRDFWNRWHITLSLYMRDVVFSPLSKFLVRLFGPGNVNHAIAVTIAVVFLLIGVWHGVGWNFAAFGAIHALGVVANHYYTIGLKSALGREGFKAYNSNRLIHAAAVAMTFCYVAGSLFFFANTFPEMRLILSAMR